MPNVLTPLEKFQHRCEGRAILWQLGYFDLHTAVDELDRVRNDLDIDADTAQAIIAAAFARVLSS